MRLPVLVEAGAAPHKQDLKITLTGMVGVKLESEEFHHNPIINYNMYTVKEPRAQR